MRVWGVVLEIRGEFAIPKGKQSRERGGGEASEGVATRPKGREHAKGIVTGRTESLRRRRHANEKGTESIASIGFSIDHSPG